MQFCNVNVHIIFYAHLPPPHTHSIQYKMSASFLEIYNETLRDLLSLSSNGSSAPSHEIKIDPERPGQVYVTNLTPVPVTSEKQVMKYTIRVRTLETNAFKSTFEAVNVVKNIEFGISYSLISGFST